MLFVEHLTLSHFRSHKVARLELDGRPVVLLDRMVPARRTSSRRCRSCPRPGLRRASADEITRQPDAIGWKIMATLVGMSWKAGRRRRRASGKD